MARGAGIHSGPLEAPRADPGVPGEPSPSGGGTPPAVEVRLLGGFRLICSGTSVALPPSAERVLALLALRGSSSRVLVAGTLWPTRTEGQAAACLRTTLWRTKKLCPTTVTTEGESIRLAAPGDVDVTDFVATARRIVGGSVAASENERTVELLNQELLPGWGDEWVVFERDRLRQLGLHALETLAARLSDRGRYDDALRVARRAVAAEPLRESSRRILTEVHLAEGDVGAARQLYEDYRRVLATELGLRPSRRFDQLLAASADGEVRRHRPASSRLPPARGSAPVAAPSACSPHAAHRPCATPS